MNKEKETIKLIIDSNSYKDMLSYISYVNSSFHLARRDEKINDDVLISYKIVGIKNKVSGRQELVLDITFNIKNKSYDSTKIIKSYIDLKTPINIEAVNYNVILLSNKSTMLEYEMDFIYDLFYFYAGISPEKFRLLVENLNFEDSCEAMVGITLLNYQAKTSEGFVTDELVNLFNERLNYWGYEMPNEEPDDIYESQKDIESAILYDYKEMINNKNFDTFTLTLAGREFMLLKKYVYFNCLTK